VLGSARIDVVEPADDLSVGFGIGIT